MTESKLNPVAEKWVAALRSGKIKQGKGRLGFQSGERCCLGVLCDLAVEAHVISHYDLQDKRLPDEVRKWAKLTSSYGEYWQLTYMDNLVTRNDLYDTFDEIANIIESQPEGLFIE